MIEGEMVIPGLLPGQSARIPLSSIYDHHLSRTTAA
jgi:hypothetical protein